MDGKGTLEVSSSKQVVQDVLRQVLNISKNGDPTTSQGNLQLELTLLHLCRDAFMRTALSHQYFFIH